MGLEAYRIKVEPKKAVTRQAIIEQFINQEFIISGKGIGDIYLEKAYDYGYAEIVIHNSEQHRIALNNYKSEHNRGKYASTHPVEDKESITIQIAKPNHENVIDSLITDLKAFSKSIPIIVTDLHTKKTVDLDQYIDLKDHYIAEHNEFSRWFPKPVYPIRCRDVFKQIDR